MILRTLLTVPAIDEANFSDRPDEGWYKVVIAVDVHHEVLRQLSGAGISPPAKLLHLTQDALVYIKAARREKFSFESNYNQKWIPLFIVQQRKSRKKR